MARRLVAADSGGRSAIWRGDHAHRAQYARRFGAVEPGFGNLCSNKGLDRFTPRGQTKVDGQWKLFCLVQNIEKLAHHGYAA